MLLLCLFWVWLPATCQSHTLFACIMAQGAEGLISCCRVQASSQCAQALSAAACCLHLTVCAGVDCCSLLPAAAAKFTGSGGAAVALCPEGVRQSEALQDACRKAGFECIQVQVGPPHSLPDMPDPHEPPGAQIRSDSQP